MSLYNAARSGTLNNLQLLLSKNADVNAQGGEYGTPLQVAASTQNYEVVKLLLAYGADVNAHEGILGSALQVAAYNGNADIVRLLLDNNADVNAQSNTRFGTALQAAAYEGKEEVVSLLLSRKADVNIQGGVHGSALQAAAYTDRRAIVKLLLANGADVNLQCGFLGNALQAAVYGKSLEVFQLLLSSGAQVNIQGGEFGTSLQAAAYKGSLPIITALLDHGSDVNLEGGKFGTALQAAAYQGNTQIVKLLLKHGASVNIQAGQYGNALQAAVCRGTPSLINFLISQGSDINAQGGEHGSAIQAAIYMKRKDVVELLLEKGAELDKPANSNGSSLVHLAVTAQDPDILKILIDAGAAAHMTEVDAFGQTPIHLAAMTDDIQTLHILFSSCMQIDINAGDIDGCTALHRAVENGAFRVAEWLLAKGARTSIEDYTMSTPFQRAAKMRNFQMMRLLFPHTTGGLTKASEWRACLPEGGSRNIILSRFESGLQSADVMNAKELLAYLETKSYPLDFFKTKIRTDKGGESIVTVNPEKMIILLEDDSLLKASTSPDGVYWRWWRKVMEKSGSGLHSIFEGWSWKIQMSKIPAAVALRQPPPEDCFLECRMLLPAYKVLPPATGLSPLAAQPMRHAVIWIMAKPSQPYPHSQHVLKSKVFFTTFEHAEIPDSPIKLFLPCIQQLENEWNSICDAGERHLSHMRTMTFHSNGRNNSLVKIHLSDAEMWTRFNETHLAQMRYLRSLIESYDRWPVLQEGAVSWLSWKRENLQSEIENAETRVRERIARLTKISQELIQLEFNLTSIAEAQKSTSANRSLKRLSWITFIFLPLMFISSLFGMNVDILESNPPWWLYLPLAGGTILLTMTIWMIFKRDSQLEDRIERRFESLFSRPAPVDEESLPVRHDLAGVRSGLANITV
ncbi:ankyrin repeat-containing domain protein [Aspergillus granulosus]|uniref:Ankyrin repeat-containing domain protein n=1 Tax=Aspergillus granulosus TaxID=176169 RepID=A0ABR4I4R3_9EURO